MSSPTPRFFVPEVVQTSMMDCGPATLKALFEGFGIAVNYGRLREVCQTSIDGTSIDMLEEVANQLGLEAEQIMVPADHLLLTEREMLPAIIVVRQPNGLTHFVVAWRCHGNRVQVMDPATGRIWPTRARFLETLYLHEYTLPAESWREWAGSEDFLLPLRLRLTHLQIATDIIDKLFTIAEADPSWYALAVLDAATRMVTELVRARGVNKGADASVVLFRFFEQSLDNYSNLIPSIYWSVRATAEVEELVFKGAVLLHIKGLRVVDETVPPEPLSPELSAVLGESHLSPEHYIWQLLKQETWLDPAVLLVATTISAFGTLIEALLFRRLLDIGLLLTFVGQRVQALVVFFIFLFVMVSLDIAMKIIRQRMGRRLEMRLRLAFLEKLPRLNIDYFNSHLISDLTYRAFEMRQLHQLPQLGFNISSTFFRLIFIMFGVIWLTPTSAPLAIFATLVTLSLSLATQPILTELDLRLTVHTGALSRFYLDALQGLMPIRTHSAEQAVRRQHENLLVEWLKTGLVTYQTSLLIGLAEMALQLSFAILILFNYLWQGGDASGLLLLFYWALKLPSLGKTLVEDFRQYPSKRNMVARLLEPLTAPDEAVTSANHPTDETPAGVAIELHDVTVQAGGHTILEQINLTIAAGEHVAIVGSSGAGKSSLVGLLLGWHQAASGEVLIDGQPLNAVALRQQTAWVDPSVQIWNRTLFENLHYGAADTTLPRSEIVEQANLFQVLEKLPQGLQTILGEGGGLVSGGEGQRVRFGRALYRPNARLVILDEPFRGLDHQQRRNLLAAAHHYWSKATLLCVTHDVADIQDFGRVLVLEQGQIVEDDALDTLAAQPDSRYHQLLMAEQAVRQNLWGGSEWRRLWLEGGQLQERKEA